MSLGQLARNNFSLASLFPGSASSSSRGLRGLLERRAPELLRTLPSSPNRQFLNRDDIGIILINQYIAEMVRHALDAHQRSIPAVLEIPSKEHPYDAAKDSILRRARGMFTAEDLR